MSMFFKHHDSFIDLSLDLHEPQDWNPGVLRTIEYASQVTALAYEPIAGLLAVDDHDKLYIYDLSTYGQPKLLATTRFDQPK
ncbi:hypothetical protein HHX47_DHR1000898 [Lentinula edodes]|nr:hypothetical protein HHX47_DHR1000898 [Lentinula edodes]